MAWSLLAFLFGFSLTHVVFSTETNITLTTLKGPIIGIRMDPNPLTNVSYDAFIGIQYGNITERFQHAVFVDSWTTAKVTQSDGPACPQTTMAYEEQCLYINVFTPMNASGTPGTLPVMAYIHGSGFTSLSSSSKSFGPDFLVPEGVVLVTFNYRLGAAGYLTLGSKVAPGNQGLFDTVLALQWVQAEISAFGGDPAQVTLFGESAGAFITQWYNIVPYFTDLFNRSIMESGAGLRDYATYSPTEGARRALLLATALNCSTTDDSVILACLQAANITDIVDNQDIVLDELLHVFNVYTPWIPVLDTNDTADIPFFGDTLENLMPQAFARNKPMIIGFNSDEGMSKMGMDNYWEIAEANLEYFIPAVALDQDLSDDQKTTAASEIENFYFPDTVDDDKMEDLIQLYTAAMFAYPSVKMARYYSNLTYGYIFSYVGSWVSENQFFSKYKLTGVSHGDELKYVFYSTGDIQYLDTCQSNQPNLNIKNQMVEWWTNFAKNGTPGSWSKISEAGYLVIDSDLSYLNTTYVDSEYYDLWAGLAAINASSSNSTSAATTQVFSTSFLIAILGLSSFSLGLLLDT